MNVCRSQGTRGSHTGHAPVLRLRSIIVVLAAICFEIPGKGEPLALGGQAPGGQGSTPSLERQVRSVLESPRYRHGHWGLLVVDGNDGQTIYEHNGNQLFAPASVTKLFSVAAALVELGPEYRFETPVVRRGEVDAKGSLHGDLILIAQGDLSMGGRTGPDGTLLFRDDDHTYAGGNPRSEIVAADPLAGLDHLAREVQGAGIKHVTGDLIVDDRLFDAADSSGSGPRRLSPIMINDNVLDLIVEPGSDAGKPASVTFQPRMQSMAMDAQVETVGSSERPKLEVRGIGPHRFTVRGKIPVGHRRVVLIHEVDDSGSFARSLFIEALGRHEVRIDSSALGDNSTRGLPARSEVAKLPRVAVYTSPPFREYAKIILKVSHNLHASTLPMLLAAHHGERTLEAGLRRQGEVLEKLGVDRTTISFGGGAGGSRADLVTPRATVALLRAMRARPDGPAYEAALPVLGRDGTLARAVPPESPARGHAHAKTGTYWVENDLTGKAVLTSKALAGYLETKSGRPLVLALFVNNVVLDAPQPKRSISEATAEAGRLLGKLCEVFYAWDENPTATGTESPTRRREPTGHPVHPRPGSSPTSQ
jgi:D-alanyl-D-alanine carboxypeptidase/D-alanyl-D-alanine-endopeptidase (penicillin-binding protein 4)